MKASLLSVDKIVFIKSSIEANPEYDADFSAEFKQLMFEFKGSRIARKIEFGYPEEDLDDPRVFSISFNLKLTNSAQKDGFQLPYDVDVAAVAFIRYRSDMHVGAERFKAVRHAAYAMLYGAIREHVSNFTARSLHGMWFLPAADFSGSAQEEAEQDEIERQEKLGLLTSGSEALNTKRKRVTKPRKVKE